MRRTLLTCMTALAAINAGAQIIADTVATGASYANQVWYSLSADEQGSAPKNNWDIAFSTTGFGSTVLINSVAGTMLWNYPKADASGYGSVDTNGLCTWPARYNSDTSWALGAMGRYADPSNSSDLDWGIYNMTTHIVTGDSLYIIKLSNGDYKKLMIEDLSAGIYHFRYANLDGTSPQTVSFDKSAYSGKNFGYYSLQTNTTLDREPASANWDLLFTQYTTFIPSAYTVTGILANAGVSVAKVTNVPDKTTFTDYATATFVSPVNTIGYNWKTFNGTGYDIKDSVVFFVEPASGDIWKVIMTGFSGSSTGSSMFTREKLYTYVPPPTSVNGVAQRAPGMALYPNPSDGQTISVVYSLHDQVNTTILVADITGRLVLADKLNTAAGLQQYLIPAGTLMPGMYVISVSAGSQKTQQKLIVR